MRYLRIIIKFPLAIITFIIFILWGALFYILPSKNEAQKRRQLMIVATWGCNTLLKILRIKVEIKNWDVFKTQKNWYIMGNHMSYTDILMVLAKFHTLFITSNEMKAKPVLGQICFFGGSFFVERRKITTLKDEIPKIADTLKEGLNITLFPEGKCSDGRGLLPFKSALIESAVYSGVNVLPLCIMYTDISGRPVNSGDFLTIGYFNGMPFMRQFKRLMMEKELKAVIEILPPVMVEGKDRKMIKAEIEEKMNSRYNQYLAGRL